MVLLPELLCKVNKNNEFETETAFNWITKFLIQDTHLDASISTFKSDNTTKWSFAKCNKDGFVEQVAEKKVISKHATTGMYLWKNGNSFVKYAKQMISKNIRVNNEFYVAPVFNEAILDSKLIGISECNNFWGLGTPEDLQHFLEKQIIN